MNAEKIAMASTEIVSISAGICSQMLATAATRITSIPTNRNLPIPVKSRLDTVAIVADRDNTLYESADPLFQKSNGKGVVLFSGRFGREKGSLQLLSAMQEVVKAVPDALLVILTAVNMQNLAEYQYEAFRPLWQNNVITGGWLAGDEASIALPPLGRTRLRSGAVTPVEQ